MPIRGCADSIALGHVDYLDAGGRGSDRCYYGVRECDKASRRPTSRDKLRVLIDRVPRSNDKGIAHVINDLSNPLGLTLNQRVVGSTPTRPTKTIN